MQIFYAPFRALEEQFTDYACALRPGPQRQVLVLCPSMRVAAITRVEDRDSYLYAREELKEEAASANAEQSSAPPSTTQPPAEDKDGGYEIPDFLKGLDDADIVKIG